MKNSTLIRRLMFLSVIAEMLYFTLITIIFVCRPDFYVSLLADIMDFEKGSISANNPDIMLTVFIFGSIAVFFITWIVTKLILDSEHNPLPMGFVIFGVMLATSILSEYCLSDSLARVEATVTDNGSLISFHRANNFVMSHCLWISTGAYIFMLMAYAVRRQKHSDFM